MKAPSLHGLRIELLAPPPVSPSPPPPTSPIQGSALVELNLSGNRLSDDGAHAMGTALANNTTLRWLDLSMNSINDEGLASIAAGMGENSTLTTLKVCSFDTLSSTSAFDPCP